MRSVLTRMLRFVQKRLSPVSWARSIGVTVGEDCRLINVSFGTEPYLITLGDHVSATMTHFETHDGGVWVFRNEEPRLDTIKKIVVGNNVFFGYRSIVMPGVTIGSNVVIGAGSVVTRDIPDNCVAAGVPARVIKSLAEYKEKSLHQGAMTKTLSSARKRQYYLSRQER